MFNKDFYPTPPEVVEQMLIDLDINQMTVFEPSSGSGAILEILRDKGAYTIACENNNELKSITQSKCDEFLKPDFLEVKSHEISHIDFIIMNPPFSADEKHMLHAWEIAPAGCVIKSLCNYETIDNSYNRYRKQINQIIKENGNTQNLGDCFSTAERKTDVEIGLVTLYKPKTGEGEFEGFFDMAEEEEAQSNGLIQHNEIREIVNRYIGSVKMFESVEGLSEQINELQKPFATYNNIQFGAYHRSESNYQTISRDQYKKSLQKAAWKTVFYKMKMEKYVTKPVLEKLNLFVEKHINVPFKMSNIYRMVDMIIQTYGENMNNAIIDIFEKLTRHTKENRYEVEGWVSNKEYLISKKFIMPSMAEHHHSGGLGIRYNGNYELLDDLTKAMCFITGTDFDNIGSLWLVFFGSTNKTHEFGTWYKWGFFEFRGYKKGTMHFKFNDEEDWGKLNKRIAEIKGLTLPSKF